MAKTPKPDDKAKPSEVRAVIAEAKLKSLLRSARSARKDLTAIAGTLGEEIKQAVEKNHLNRKVFRTIVDLDRLEPEKLRDWLDDFEHYLELSGLAERAKSVNPMGFGPGGKDKPKAVNVRPFPPPGSVAAE